MSNTYYEAHKEEMKAYQKARYQANKEKIKTKAKASYEANKEEKLAYQKDYNESNKEERKIWRESRKEEKKAYDKAYDEAHKEEQKTYDKTRYEANKEEIKFKQKVYQKANPEKFRAKVARRRAKKAGVVTLPIRPNFLDYLIEVWDDKCAYCRNRSDTYHKDHFMPLELKGHEAEYNYVLACPSCNLSKGHKHPFLFIKEQKICFTFKPYMKFVC